MGVFGCLYVYMFMLSVLDFIARREWWRSDKVGLYHYERECLVMTTSSVTRVRLHSFSVEVVLITTTKARR